MEQKPLFDRKRKYSIAIGYLTVILDISTPFSWNGICFHVCIYCNKNDAQERIFFPFKYITDLCYFSWQVGDLCSFLCFNSQECFIDISSLGLKWCFLYLQRRHLLFVFCLFDCFFVRDHSAWFEDSTTLLVLRHSICDGSCQSLGSFQQRYKMCQFSWVVFSEGTKCVSFPLHFSTTCMYYLCVIASSHIN